MSMSAAFHKNVSLLLQAVQPSYDFKKHYKEGMFEKPNTAGFTYVSHYLLSIYDPDYVKKMVEWPIVCKKSEAKYRNDVKEFLNIISNDNSDIGFPSIVPSLLLSPGGTKFIKVMWKLSQVALREYIKRQSEHEVLFAPKRGPAEELTESLIKNIINNTNDSNSKIHEDLVKSEEEAKKYALEEKEKIIKTQKEIFAELEIVASLSAEAPVHPSFQKRLLDFDDEEIIRMWKEDLKKSLTYFKNKVEILKATEDISKTIFRMVSNIISESTVLNANFLQKIDIYAISELPFPKIKVLAQHVYTNGNFNLLNYFLLLSTMTEHCGHYISTHGFLDFYHCYSQLEGSCSDLKRISEFLYDLHSRMVQFSCEVQQKPDLTPIIQYDHNESSITASDLKNVMFMPSPPIQFNANNNGRVEMQNRLKLTPVEGVHKQLFLRYNKNKDDSAINLSRVRQNLIVTRINFDDTISTEISERQSPCQHFMPPKTIWSTCKPAGKYSRLFSTRSTQPTNKAVNCSMLSIPCSAKANSTVMNNICDGNNAELTIDITMKSLFSYSSDTSVVEKKSTPKRSNRFFDIPETSVDVNKQYLSVNKEEVKFNKPCSPITSPIECNRQKGRRRSITDLVERYKRVMEKSTVSAAKLDSVIHTNISEE